MNRDDFCRVYLDYFLVLENDMLNIEQYVSFDLGDNAVYDSSICSDFGNSLCFPMNLLNKIKLYALKLM